MTRALPRYILARKKARAFLELKAVTGTQDLPWEKARQGSLGSAAKVGDWYLAWGFAPSSIAARTVENVLSMYSNRDSSQDSPPPRVFYLCYAGTHTSIVAGSMHLGRLCQGGDPCGLPEFDRRLYRDIGVPCFLGTDPWGAQVYALGTGWLSLPLEMAICDLVELSSPNARACFCAVRGYLDSQARLGGFISRRCGLVSFGRKLISASLKKRLPDIQEAVDSCLDLSAKWKDNQGQPKGEVTWSHGPTAGRAYRHGGGA